MTQSAGFSASMGQKGHTALDYGGIVGRQLIEHLQDGVFGNDAKSYYLADKLDIFRAPSQQFADCQIHRGEAPPCCSACVLIFYPDQAFFPA